MTIADVHEIKAYIAKDSLEAAIQMGAVIYSTDYLPVLFSDELTEN